MGDAPTTTTAMPSTDASTTYAPTISAAAPTTTTTACDIVVKRPVDGDILDACSALEVDWITDNCTSPFVQIWLCQMLLGGSHKCVLTSSGHSRNTGRQSIGAPSEHVHGEAHYKVVVADDWKHTINASSGYFQLVKGDCGQGANIDFELLLPMSVGGFSLAVLVALGMCRCQCLKRSRHALLTVFLVLLFTNAYTSIIATANEQEKLPVALLSVFSCMVMAVIRVVRVNQQLNKASSQSDSLGAVPVQGIVVGTAITSEGHSQKAAVGLPSGAEHPEKTENSCLMVFVQLGFIATALTMLYVMVCIHGQFDTGCISGIAIECILGCGGAMLASRVKPLWGRDAYYRWASAILQSVAETIPSRAKIAVRAVGVPRQSFNPFQISGCTTFLLHGPWSAKAWFQERMDQFGEFLPLFYGEDQLDMPREDPRVRRSVAVHTDTAERFHDQAKAVIHGENVSQGRVCARRVRITRVPPVED